jgi:catechol 2,3-dioxygenase-like lactoylglutathione lyase family enzyme
VSSTKHDPTATGETVNDDRPVLDQINIVGRDMARVVDFYRRLGLECPDSDQTWDTHHRDVKAGADVDVEIDSETFARWWCKGWTERSTVVLGFKVRLRESVDQLYADLTANGHRGLQPPYDAFWGARYAIVEDPAGNAVGIMSAADPTRRTAPPEPARFA